MEQHDQISCRFDNVHRPFFTLCETVLQNISHLRIRTPIDVVVVFLLSMHPAGPCCAEVFTRGTGKKEV